MVVSGSAPHLVHALTDNSKDRKMNLTDLIKSMNVSSIIAANADILRDPIQEMLRANMAGSIAREMIDANQKLQSLARPALEAAQQFRDGLGTQAIQWADLADQSLLAAKMAAEPIALSSLIHDQMRGWADTNIVQLQNAQRLAGSALAEQALAFAKTLPKSVLELKISARSKRPKKKGRAKTVRGKRKATSTQSEPQSINDIVRELGQVQREILANSVAAQKSDAAANKQILLLQKRQNLATWLTLLVSIIATILSGVAMAPQIQSLAQSLNNTKAQTETSQKNSKADKAAKPTKQTQQTAGKKQNSLKAKKASHLVGAKKTRR